MFKASTVCADPSKPSGPVTLINVQQNQTRFAKPFTSKTAVTTYRVGTSKDTVITQSTTMDDSPRPPAEQTPPPPPPPVQSHTGSPTDFLKGVVGKRVIVRLTSGVDYKGEYLCIWPSMLYQHFTRDLIMS